MYVSLCCHSMSILSFPSRSGIKLPFVVVFVLMGDAHDGW